MTIHNLLHRFWCVFVLLALSAAVSLYVSSGHREGKVSGKDVPPASIKPGDVSVVKSVSPSLGVCRLWLVGWRDVPSPEKNDCGVREALVKWIA